MRRIALPLLVALAVAVPFVAPPVATGGELAGVTLPDTLDARGQPLVLNGMGVRKKGPFKVYVAGLYLPAPSRDANAIATGTQPRAFRMHFVRDVSRDKLIEGFRDGFAKNGAAYAARAGEAIDGFLAVLTDVEDGTELTYVYAPGHGTTVSLGARGLATFPGDDFAAALFLVYLGADPPTEELKDGLLGAAS